MRNCAIHISVNWIYSISHTLSQTDWAIELYKRKNFVVFGECLHVVSQSFYWTCGLVDIAVDTAVVWVSIKSLWTLSDTVEIVPKSIVALCAICSWHRACRTCRTALLACYQVTQQKRSINTTELTLVIHVINVSYIANLWACVILRDINVSCETTCAVEFGSALTAACVA